MTLDFSTIAAISTPPGVGGIGVIRISGSEAVAIAGRIFRRSNGRAVNLHEVESHRVLYGRVCDPASGVAIDEVLLTWMAAPQTYTTEDTVEISCHGGQMPLQETLRVILAAGARHAEPGEFTLRAFLNGRLDLSQAEAVLNVVGARTAEALQLAVGDLQGELTRRIEPASEAVISLLAYLDAAADFPEDEIPGSDVDADLWRAIEALEAIVAGSRAGMLYRDGAQVALVGRPNVGKSSLMNALLRTDRAIVTPIAGTTRDVISETCNINGIPVTLLDTAGIAETTDIVERLGIERSRKAMSGAAAVILVLDGSVAPGEEDLRVASMLADEVSPMSPPVAADPRVCFPGQPGEGADTGVRSYTTEPSPATADTGVRSYTTKPSPATADTGVRSYTTQPSPATADTRVRGYEGGIAGIQRNWRPVVIAINKRDLPECSSQLAVTDLLPGVHAFELSSKTGEGIDMLEAALAGILQQDELSGVQPALTTTRQRAAIERALTHLQEAFETRAGGYPLDLMATDVRAALHAIGEVTGENVDEAVLAEIFSRFCIGK